MSTWTGPHSASSTASSTSSFSVRPSPFYSPSCVHSSKALPKTECPVSVSPWLGYATPRPFTLSREEEINRSVALQDSSGYTAFMNTITPPYTVKKLACAVLLQNYMSKNNKQALSAKNKDGKTAYDLAMEIPNDHHLRNAFLEITRVNPEASETSAIPDLSDVAEESDVAVSNDSDMSGSESE